MVGLENATGDLEDCATSTTTGTSEEDAADKREQLPLTPEIPIPEYSDEDMSKLVEYIQRMTILFALDQRDWNEAVLDMIRRWLLEVEYCILTIFYDGNTLRGCLGFPLVPVNDISYFLRDNNQIFTVDGFHDEVRFGTVHDDVDSCLLKIFRLVYAPAFRNGSTEWKESLRSRLCKAMDRFLTLLTSLHYKLGGITVIYVPCKQLAEKPDPKDRVLIKSLEELVVFWCTQIRTLLNDNLLSASNGLVVPQDECNFWLYRCEVLQGICLQLEHSEVQEIIELLRTSHSVYLREVEGIIKECRNSFDKAKSNVRFLTLVVKPCSEIDGAENPSTVPALIPRAIHLIRYVWLNSEHYNSRELISGLFCQLSNQIIKFCIKKVSIAKVLSGNSRFGIKTANMAIDCCMAYKEIYARISKAHSERDSGFGWDLDDAKIFNHVDAFIERLNDVIEICEAMIVFARLDETETLSRPYFGGSDGVEFEMIVCRVEEQFLESLKALQASGKAVILNVYNNSWYQYVAGFRQTVQKLEETVQRLMSNAFQRIANIEEGLEVLNVTLFYSYHSNIRKMYLRHVSEIWKMFHDDMVQTAKTLREASVTAGESWLPPHASRALKYRVNLERLQWIRDRLYNSDWLPKVEEEKKTLSAFEMLKKDFQRAVRSIYDEWYQYYDSVTLLNKLQRSLLIRSKVRAGLLECNIDRNVLIICDEAQHFERLGFQITGNLHALYDQYEVIKNLYEKVLKVCLAYNHILTALSHKERELFKALIVNCDRAVFPGLTKLTWNADISEAYFVDCSSRMADLQRSVDIYKCSNKHMALACERICDTPFLKIALSGPLQLAEFESNVATYYKAAMQTITTQYNLIVELLTAVYREFQANIKEMSSQWSAYIHQFDMMLETALLISAQNSLNSVLKIFHTEENLTVASILIADLDIRSYELQLCPDVSTIMEMITGLFKHIVQGLETFPRLHKKMRLLRETPLNSFAKIFATADETIRLQKSIDSELNLQQKELDGFLEGWQNYQDVWLISEKEFITKIRSTDRNAKVYADSIEHYNSLAQSILVKDSLKKVHFILLNQNPIKNALLDMIEKWQVLNMQLLTRRAFSRLRQIHRYMSRHGNRVTIVPRSLQEARRSLAFYQKLVVDAAPKLDDIPGMLDLFKLLDKQQVDIPPDIYDLIFSLDSQWAIYIQKLIEADELLENNSEDIKRNLNVLTDKCKLIMKKFLSESMVKRLQ